MGEKKVSVRTLPSGERVRHFPDGTMELIHDRSVLRERLDAALRENRRRHNELKATHQRRVQVKRDVQQAKGLPSEKSPI